MTRSAQAISTRTIDFPGNMAATPSSLLMAGRSDRCGEPFWRGSNGTDRDPCHADQRARADRCRNRTRVFLRVVSPRELATPRAGTRYISRRTVRERARTVRQLLVRLARNCSDDTADARSDSLGRRKALPIWRGTDGSNPSPSSGESANFQSLTTKVFVLVLWISRSIPDSEAFRQQHPNGTRSPLRRRCAESAGR